MSAAARRRAFAVTDAGEATQRRQPAPRAQGNLSIEGLQHSLRVVRKADEDDLRIDRQQGWVCRGEVAHLLCRLLAAKGDRPD